MNKTDSSLTSTVTHSSDLKPRAKALGRRLALGFAAMLGVGLILGLAGCGYEALTANTDDQHYPPPGQMVDVGGFWMHISCTGEGATTVILDAGLGGASLDWSLIQPTLSGSTRVCAYDRAGMGWSDPSPEPRTPEQIARELHTLLLNAQIAPPYVLVGHSLAGKNVRMFAAQHPDEVAGMVLIDARSEYVDAKTSRSEADGFKAAYQLQGIAFQVARKAGIARLLGEDILGFPSTIPAHTRQTMALLMTSDHAVNAATAEAIKRESSDPVLEAAPSLGELPLVVLAASENMKGLAFWPEAQDAQARLSSNSRLAVIESGHYIHWQHPDVVIGAVKEVITKAQLRSETSR